MKNTILTILGFVALAVGANFLCDGCGGSDVTKRYFDERISAVEEKVDSLMLVADLIQKELKEVKTEVTLTKHNTDSIKTEVRENGVKLDSLSKDVKAVKTSTSKIEFKLF